MQYQLRRYTVAEGKMAEFLEVFPAVVEARSSSGFVVVGAWTVPEENGFVWIVGTDDPGGIAGATQRYYDSPLRAAISPEPASFLVDIQTTDMEALPGF